MADDDPRQARNAPGADGDRDVPGGEHGVPDGEPDVPGHVSPSPPPPREPAWSGRAEVPPRRPGPFRDQAPVDWSHGAEPDDGRWWMPIVVGVIGLVLLSVLVVAGWAIIDSTRRNPTAPSPPVLSTPAITPGPTSAAPTTAPATPPGTTPTASIGTTVVPPLVGLSVTEAIERLDEAGLVPRLQFQESRRVPGTVLETDPSGGLEVQRGDEVTLVIARPRLAPPTTAGPTAPATPTPGGARAGS